MCAHLCQRQLCLLMRFRFLRPEGGLCASEWEKERGKRRVNAFKQLQFERMAALPFRCLTGESADMTGRGRELRDGPALSCRKTKECGGLNNFRIKAMGRTRRRGGCD